MSLTAHLMETNPCTPFNADKDKSPAQILSYEEALSLAGDHHMYQLRVALLIAMGMLIAGLQIMGFPFIFKMPSAECLSPTGEWMECTPSPENCRNPVRPAPGALNSIIVTYDLICKGDEYRALAESIYMIASALGVVTFGSISDKYGKKDALTVTYITTSISLLACPFMPTWTLFLVFLVLSGLGRAPFIYYGYQLLVEVSNEKFRALGVLTMGVSFALGAAFTGLINALVNSDWQKFYFFFIAVPSLICLPLVMQWADESPMSYFPKYDYESAKRALRRISEVNQRYLPYFNFDQERRRTSFPNKEESLPAIQEYSFLDLFKYKSLRVAALGGAYVCFVTYFVFYGQMLALDTIASDPVTVAVLTSIIEAIACIASTPILTKWNRRSTLVGSFGLTALAFLLFSMTTSNSDSQLSTFIGYVELCLGRFWVALLMCTTFVYANELFPTVVRSRGSGLVNFFGRVGSVIPSTVIYICKREGISPTLIFGAVAVSGCWVAFYMKETKGKPLSHYIEEEEQKGKLRETEMHIFSKKYEEDV